MTCNDETHLEPYREAVKQQGTEIPGFKAALWGSRETQLLRFDVMIELAGFEGCVILDVGCGTGDLAQHLHERGIEFARYIGLDAVPELVAAAKQRGLPRCEFHLQNVFESLPQLSEHAADFAVMSGTLNTMHEASARTLVQHAFESAAQGVVFNFLSDRPHPDWLERDLHPARRFNTVAWLDWTLNLTPKVTFTQDYLNGHDATILLRH